MVLLAACAVIFIMHEAYAQQQLAEPAVNENMQIFKRDSLHNHFRLQHICSIRISCVFNSITFHIRNTYLRIVPSISATGESSMFVEYFCVM